MMRPSIISTVLALSIPISAITNDSFPRVNGLKFDIDGVTEYWAGTNAYWLPFLMKNADMDIALDHIAGAGLKILRTWGFNDVNSIPPKGTRTTTTTPKV
jgi:mannan endo-1,4-beta-mannosidase